MFWLKSSLAVKLSFNSKTQTWSFKPFMLTYCLHNEKSVVISSHVMHSTLVLILCPHHPLTSSILVASFSLKVGYSDLADRPRFQSGIDVILVPRKSCRRALPDSPWRPSGVVVSPAMSCPVLALRTVAWNQTETTINRTIIHCVTCSFVPFHQSIWVLGIFQNSRPEWTWCTNRPDEMCNKVYKFWNEVYKLWWAVESWHQPK